MADYDIMTALGSAFPDWAPIAGVLIVLAATLAAIVYLVGIVISNDKVKTWAKIEFVEVAYSGILLVLILALVGQANAIVQDIAKWKEADPYGYTDIICGPQFESMEYFDGLPCHIRLGMVYLNNLFNEGRGTAYDIYKVYIFTSAFAEMNINLEGITEQAGVFAYNPIKGFFVVGNTVKGTVFDYTTKIMTINKFQEVFLRLITVGLFPVMLMLGLVLRCFFFTRKLGGLLMALAIALFFIYPMFYVIGGWFYNVYKFKACMRYLQDNPTLYACPPDVSAFNELYTSDMAGFPTLDGTELNTGALDAANLAQLPNQYQGTTQGFGMNYIGLVVPGSATAMNVINNYFDPNKALNPSNPSYQLNLCKTMTSAEIKAQLGDGKNSVGSLNEKKQEIFEKLKARSLYDKAAFLAETFGQNGYGGYIDATSKLTFFSLFFSFMGVMATIAAVKSLSGIFGGDLEIAGLTHLI